MSCVSVTKTERTTFFKNWSWMFSSRNSLPAAMQFSPLLKNTELRPWKTHSMPTWRFNHCNYWNVPQQWRKLERTYHAHSLVHVTVTEDDERGFSSELQRNFLHVADRTASEGEQTRCTKMSCSVQFCWVTFVLVVSVSPLHDVFTDFSGASEAQFTDIRMVRQTLTHQSAYMKSVRSIWAPVAYLSALTS